MANTGSLYKKVPLRFFQSLRRLNLNGTAISTGDFGKVASVAKHIRVLNIESCLNINESAIFKAKDSLLRLVRIDISYNTHFSVRSIACLCSYRSLQEVCAKGNSTGSHGHIIPGKDFSPFSEWRHSARN